MIKYNTQTGGTALKNTNNDEPNQSNISEYNDKGLEKEFLDKHRTETRNDKREVPNRFILRNHKILDINSTAETVVVSYYL